MREIRPSGLMRGEGVRGHGMRLMRLSRSEMNNTTRPKPKVIELTLLYSTLKVP